MKRILTATAISLLIVCCSQLKKDEPQIKKEVRQFLAKHKQEIQGLEKQTEQKLEDKLAHAIQNHIDGSHTAIDKFIKAHQKEIDKIAQQVQSQANKDLNSTINKEANKLTETKTK